MSHTVPRPLTDLARSVVPLAALAMSGRGEEAEAAGRRAVRVAADWFLADQPTDMLAGHEFDRYALEQWLGRACRQAALDVDDASAARSGIEFLAEGLMAAALREQHAPGWIRPRHLPEAEARTLLRAGIQAVVNAAVFIRTGDPMAGARAQDASAGIELDAEALSARLEAFDAAPRPAQG